MNEIPSCFLYIICTLLDDRYNIFPKVNHRIYLDDCKIGESDVWEHWKGSLASLYRLTIGELPINLWKCIFLM